MGNRSSRKDDDGAASHRRRDKSYADGSFYTGQWQGEQYHGQGTVTWPSGDRFTGHFVEGRQHGAGEWLSGADGARYAGAFANGAKHGMGEETYADGGTYAGAFSRGRKHGRGVHTWARGDRRVRRGPALRPRHADVEGGGREDGGV